MDTVITSESPDLACKDRLNEDLVLGIGQRTVDPVVRDAARDRVRVRWARASFDMARVGCSWCLGAERFRHRQHRQQHTQKATHITKIPPTSPPTITAVPLVSGATRVVELLGGRFRVGVITVEREGEELRLDEGGSCA